jgi:phasin family protein
MFSIPEQFSAVTNFQSNFQTQLQSQLNFVNSVAGQAVESVGKVAALNIHTARASVEKSTATTRQLLNVKDAQEFFNQAFQPGSLESLVEYGRELYAIAAEAQAELIKATSEQTKDVVPAAVLKLAGPVKAVKQIVVTDEEAPAPKAAKAKAKPATEAEVTVEEEEAKAPFPTAASVEADAKPAKVKAKPVH